MRKVGGRGATALPAGRPRGTDPMDEWDDEVKGGGESRLPIGRFVERPRRIRESCRELARGKVGCAYALVE